MIVTADFKQYPDKYLIYAIALTWLYMATQGLSLIGMLFTLFLLMSLQIRNDFPKVNLGYFDWKKVTVLTILLLGVVGGLVWLKATQSIFPQAVSTLQTQVDFDRVYKIKELGTSQFIGSLSLSLSGIMGSITGQVVDAYEMTRTGVKVLSAFSEEILFRGSLAPIWIARSGNIGFIGAAAAFSAWHAFSYNVWESSAFIVAFISAIVFQLITQHFNMNIAPAAVLHTAINLGVGNAIVSLMLFLMVIIGLKYFSEKGEQKRSVMAA